MRERPGETLEMEVLIVAVPTDHGFHVMLVHAPVRQLRAQRRADAGHPLWHRGGMLPFGKGELHALHQQADGVDQGAVEVEEQGWACHASTVMAIMAVITQRPTPGAAKGRVAMVGPPDGGAAIRASTSYDCHCRS